MEYTQLGKSGLAVSRIGLGCMGLGDPARGVNPWALDEQAARPVFRAAVELGVNFWDTANVYGHGASELLLGRAVKEFSRREDVVVATKVGLPMHHGPDGSGLAAAAIAAQTDGSLARLKTDYVDLYQVHRFDPRVPVEETMQALDAVVRSGKARAIGASSMWAWQFAKMQFAAVSNGWQPFVSMQDQYSLVQREEEREMLPLLADQGVSSLPWCALAKGRLARAYGQVTKRAQNDPVAERAFGSADRRIVGAVQHIAAERGVSMAQVALAWVLHNPVVAAPVVGATTADQLVDAAGATRLYLEAAEMHALEEGYTPRRTTGF